MGVMRTALLVWAFAPTLLAVWNTSEKAHGIYYLPSMAGIDPLDTYGGPDLYGHYFEPIYRRDLALMAKTSNVVRLSGIASGHVTKQFLDAALEHNLSVILTFSLLEYNLLRTDIRERKQLIHGDFVKFVDAHKDHPAVAMWAFGDVLDPIFGEDHTHEASSGEYAEFLKLFLGLLAELVNLLHQRDPQRPTAMSLYIEDSNSDVTIQQFQAHFGAPSQSTSFDYWIFVIGDNPLKLVRGESFDTMFNRATTSGRQFLVQFSNSAFDAKTAQVNYREQDTRVALMSMFFQQEALEPWRRDGFNGLLNMEWSDQWWRGDTDYSCNSGLAQPFFQSFCNRGFHGLTYHTNSFGQHCITLRPSVVTWARALNGSVGWNETAHQADPSWSPGRDGLFNTLENGQRYCVNVWPTIFTNSLMPYYVVPLLGIGILNIVLWILWARAKRAEKSEIQGYLKICMGPEDEEAPAQAEVADKHVKEEEMSLVANGEGLEEPDNACLRTQVLEIPGCAWKFQFTSYTRIPMASTNEASEQNNLEMHFREHLRRAKLNLDALVQHEESVLRCFVDYGLIYDLETKEAIYDQAVRIMHCRLLEGLRCWQDKCRIQEDHRVVTDCYGEALLFRFLSSISEHISHCPERLSYLLHRIILTAAENRNLATYIVSLDDLQDGLAGPCSIMENTINFDDINDCGIMNEQKLRKTWWESQGPAVMMDYLRDYSPIIFFKLWLFAVAIALGIEFTNYTTDFFLPFASMESAAFFATEILLLLYHAFWQARKFPVDRLQGLLVGVVSVSLVWAVMPVLANTLDLLIPLAAYAAFRIVYCVLPHQFVKAIFCRRTATFYQTQMKGTPRVRDVQMVFNCPPPTVSQGKKSTYFQSLFFWFLVFASTIVTEVYLLVPVAGMMTFTNMCYTNYLCSVKHSILDSNLCFACHLTVSSAYLLMGVTIFIDTPLVFYVMVSLWGYYKGQTRKIQNVYAREACHVDLTATGAERKNMMVVFGDWERNSYNIWKTMIDELYCRDLICEADKFRLQTPGKKYDFTGINSEARERLSFFLRTTKSMAKAKRRHRHQAFLSENTKAKLYMVTREMEDDEMERAVRKISVTREMQQQQERDKRRRTVAIGIKYRLRPESSTVYQTASRGLLLLDSVVEEEEEDLYGSEEEEAISMEKPGLRRASSTLRADLNWKVPVPDTFSPDGRDEWAKVVAQRDRTPFPHIAGKGEDEEPLSPLDLNEDENIDWFIRAIPRLSHIITTYTEHILLSREYLQSKNGHLTNLEHLINLSSYEMEWKFFEERFRGQKGLPSNRDLLVEFLNARPNRSTGLTRLEKELVQEVRLWSSYRAQTVARTIRGALSYQESLQTRFDSFERCDEGPMDLKVEQYCELIIAAQTYASYPGAHNSKSKIRGWKERREDLEWLLRQNSAYPIMLVYDYAPPPPPKNRVPPKNGGDDFDHFWMITCEKYWEKDEQEMERYWAKRCEEYGLPAEKPTFKHATCVKQMVNGVLTLTHVLPRMFPLLLGSGSNRTQGKAANQINALRTVSGHVIQVSDSNMDGWCGEGFKLPYITRMLIDGDVSRRRVGDRAKATARIIGFREYIFTGPLGSVGAAMASSEFVFGTLFQRVLSDPLDVRMHYGHPDFFDAFWVLNRGTLSKASPRLNLSEDVFAGYNVALRGEKILHSDRLEWQKGRETVFTAASGFLTKISAGSVAIQRTRDMKHIQLTLPFTQKLSLYYGGLGSFINHLMIDFSIDLYVIFFFLAAFSNITLAHIQLVGSSLGMEWLVGLGLVSSLGYVTEMMLEYGWGAGLVHVVAVLPATGLFYLFQNKCMAVALQDSMRTGNAAYVDTGRPNAFDHYSTRQMYRMYATSHYYPALYKVTLYLLYLKFVGQSGGALPMVLVGATTVSWIFAPVIFCPQASNLTLLMDDAVSAFNFVFSTRAKLDDKTAETSMDKYWRKKEIGFHALDIMGTRIVWLLLLLVPGMLLWTIAFSSMIDYAFIYLYLFAGHVMLTFAFFFSNYTNVVRGLWMCGPLIGVALINMLFPVPKILGTEAMMGLFLFLYLLRVVHWTVLLMMAVLTNFRIRCKCCKVDAKGAKVRYEKFVSNCFFFFLNYHVHLYCAVMIVVAQTMVQIGVMIIVWAVQLAVKGYKMSLAHSVVDGKRVHGNVKVE